MLQRALQRTVVEEVTWRVLDYSTYRDKLGENPLRVFIAHDLDDGPKAQELYEKLKAKDYVKPWLSEENLTGISLHNIEEWEPPLWEALREAECVIICFSHESIRNRGYFKKKEIPFILEKAGGSTELSAYIVLVKLEECKIPRRYGKWDVAEVYTESGYEKLLDKMEKNIIELRIKRNIQYNPRTHFK
jgi:hypothetical protein